jgi:hypothetical protein
MAIKLTVSAAQRVISGRCEKSTANYQSSGANDGHEWEAQCGLELDLDGAAAADAGTLHGAITAYQRITQGAVKAHLKSMGAPAALVDATPAVTTAAVSAAPAPAPAGTSSQHLSTWGGQPAAVAPAPAPAPAKKAPPAAAAESEEEDDGPPPRTGKQLLGWAAKQEPDAKGWIYDWGRATKVKGRVLDWPEKTVAKCYEACKASKREEE